MSHSHMQGRILRCFLTFAFAFAFSILTMSGAASAEPAADILSEPSADSQVMDKLNKPSDDKQEKTDRKHTHMHKHGMYIITEAAGIIGVEPDKLKKELKAGKSIAEVAKSKGIDEADLMDQLIAIKLKKIDDAVKSGKWTTEKADKMKEKLPDHIRHILNHKGFHKSRESSVQE